MVVVNVTAGNCQPQTIVIGRRGTYDTMQIAFDLSNLIEAYGSGVAVLAVKRSQDESAYPAVVTQEDNTLTWTVSETDTAYVGAGECQLMWYVDGGLAKTIIYPMVVMRDILATSEDAPDAYPNWIESLTALGAETQQNALDAAQSATDAESAATRAEDALEEFTTPTASATSLAPDQQATASYSDGHFSFGIPRGATGTTGETPDFSIGTVETLEPDQPATATITGTPESPVLNLGIPKGEKGEGGGGAVESVNGKTGAVVLTASDVGAKPASYEAPVSSVAGKTGAVTLDAGDASFDDSVTYASGTVGAELSDQKNAIDTKAPVIINTVSGDIATFADGADGMPIKHLIANIEPVQSGTGDPSPENIRPISGWTGLTGARTGKNLLPNKKYQDTRIRVQLGQESADYFILKAGTYKLSYGLASGVSAGPYWRVRDGAAQNGTNIVLSEDSEIRIWLFGDPISADDVLWWQLEHGSTATDYEPFQGDTISVSWATEAGTVYGGTLDGITGALTVTWAEVDLGTLTYGYNTTYSVFSAYKGDIKNFGKCISSQYAYNHGVNAPDMTCCLGSTGWFVNNIVVKDSRYTDAATFKAAVSGVQLVYELATPQTYQLAPVTVNTLLGNNTVYVDCGSVSVDYPADTGIVVAQQSNAISQKQDVTSYVTLSGTIVTQTGEDNTMYLCGELAELTFTAPQTGQTAIRFTSGTTPTVATFTGVTWLNGFDPSAIEASKTYEVNILYGVGVASWT